MPLMKTNFDGLVRLLAENLYPEPDVFVRELVQNAHDAIQFRRRVQPAHEGRIHIGTDRETRTLTFVDNGIGMDADDIDRFLSTIGSSGTGTKTRALLAEPDRGELVETIGQFGIGLLSAFVVAQRVTVLTRKLGCDTGYRWVNEGSQEYLLHETNELDEPGTTVILQLDVEYNNFLSADYLAETVRTYADLLPFPIFIDGEGPANTVDAPWHREGLTDEERHRALSDFVHDRHGVYPLTAMEVDFEEPRARGVLYLPPGEIPGADDGGFVDLFQERMCIRSRDRDLLPPWARFVRGVIDTPDLTPTAARDNVKRDETYRRLQQRLGAFVSDQLVELSERRPRRFERVCREHHLAMRGMALRDDDFFEVVVELLSFDTNQGRMNLSEYAERQPAEADGRTPLYVFGSHRDSKQFYELCEARGLVGINAGHPYDEELIETYAHRQPGRVVLRSMETLVDEHIFEPLEPAERARFAGLQVALTNALADIGRRDVLVEMRRIEPDTLPSVLLDAQVDEARAALEAFLAQPAIAEAYRGFADRGLEALVQKQRRLFVNADHPMVARLAARPDLADGTQDRAILSLYFLAMLNSREQLTEANAERFADYLQTLVDEHVDLTENASSMHRGDN